MPPPPPPPRRFGSPSTPPPPPALRTSPTTYASIPPAAVPEQRQPIYDVDAVEDTNSYELTPQIVSPVPAAAQRRCPSCSAQLSASAVLCLNCGYDTRLGTRRFAPRYESESHSHGPSTFMKIVGWGEFGLAGLSVLCTGISFAMHSSPKDATACATFALIIGFVIIISGKLRMISALGGESFFLVIVYLFVPFGAIFLIVTRWDIMCRGFLVMLMGVGVVFLAAMATESFKNSL